METIKVLIKGLISNIFFTVILFLCAGKVDYIQGWIFLSSNIIATIMNVLYIHHNTELAVERSNPGEGVKSWDKLLLGLSAIVYLVMIIIAGLDSGRFLWTDHFNWILSFLGVLLLILGQFLFLTARKQNQFFSTLVRIQKDRDHQVCEDGLYRIIRHPGYLGMILSLIGIPLITISFWCIFPTIIAIILLLIRTSMEDATLQKELKGYDEYSRKTHYKLIPFIW